MAVLWNRHTKFMLDKMWKLQGNTNIFHLRQFSLRLGPRRTRAHHPKIICPKGITSDNAKLFFGRPLDYSMAFHNGAE